MLYRSFGDRFLNQCNFKRSHTCSKSFCALLLETQKTANFVEAIAFSFRSKKSILWQEAGSKLGLLMQDMLLDTFPETVHFDGRPLFVSAGDQKQSWPVCTMEVATTDGTVSQSRLGRLLMLSAAFRETARSNHSRDLSLSCCRLGGTSHRQKLPAELGASG